MSGQIISIAVLLVVFVIGTVRPVNLGAVALVATFGVGMLVAGESFDKAISGFPIAVFVLLVGVTYLFGIASVNGTIEWLVTSAARLVRENRVVIPWVLFLLAAIPTTVGAAGPAGVALLAPIALRMSEKYRIDPRLTGLMVVNGSNAGNFSPINVLGVIVNSTAQHNGLAISPLSLWLGNFVFTVALGAVVFLIYGGRELIRDRRSDRVAVTETETESAGTEPQAPAPDGGVVTAVEPAPGVTRSTSVAVLASTLTAIVLVAAGALVFGQDIGMLAVIAAVLLHLVFPRSSAGAPGKIGWSTVLLICGVVTYVALLQRMGTVKMIGDSVAGISISLLAALLLCLIAAVTSAFASSIGVLGALIPLAVPFLLTGGVGATGVVIALSISATAVDATPFSSIGALTVASAPEAERDRLYRGLLRWGFAMVPIAPLAAWSIFVVL
jgi:Na+/H+ antiporter NhaD/arsenite permease-like protein